MEETKTISFEWVFVILKSKKKNNFIIYYFTLMVLFSNSASELSCLELRLVEVRIQENTDRNRVNNLCRSLSPHTILSL